jgi:hypothetical protein
MAKHTVETGQAVIEGIVTFSGEVTDNGYTNAVVQLLLENEYGPHCQIKIGKKQEAPDVMNGDRVRCWVWLGGTKKEGKPFWNVRLAKLETLDAQPRGAAPKPAQAPAKPAADPHAADMALPADDSGMPF